MKKENLNKNPHSNNLPIIVEANDISHDRESLSLKPRESTLKGRKRAISYVVDEKSNLFKIMIPYDFLNKKYSLNAEVFDFYDNKEYLLSKVEEFNSKELFSMDYNYKFQGLEMIKAYITDVLISIVYIYFSLFIILCTYFNLGIIFLLLFGFSKIIYTLGKKRFIWAEQIKMDKIKEILNSENNSQLCIDLGLRWELGKNGYWIELHKLCI
jgi:hypothetical protein